MALLAVLAAGGVAAFLQQFFAQHEFKHHNHCTNRKEVINFAWSGFWANVAFVSYAQLFCLSKHDPSFLPGPCEVTNETFRTRLVCFIYLVGIAYYAAKGWGAYMCPGIFAWDYVFLVFGLCSFLLNATVLGLGKYQQVKDLHLSTYILMAVVVFIELVVEVWYEGHADIFLAYNYFNIKIGVVVFEVFTDKHDWLDFSWCAEMPVFFVYLAARMGKQIYLYAVFHGGESQNAEIAFGVCSIVECLILLGAIRMLLRPGGASSTLTAPLVAADAHEQELHARH